MGLAVDTSGNVYITGYVYGFGGNFTEEVLVLKYNSTLSLVWERTWGGSTTDVGQSVAVDSLGNVIVTGYSESFGSGAADVFLLKFNSTGSLLWQRTRGGRSDDIASGVAVDIEGNAVLTGNMGGCAPYTLASAGNSTLGTPSFTQSNATFILGTPPSHPATPQGTVGFPSGGPSYCGAPGLFLLKYGGPHFSITFETSMGEGSITFNSATYMNGQIGNYAYGNYTITANPPSGYRFIGWTTTGNVSIADPKKSSTTATITGPAALKADFTEIIASPIAPISIHLAALTVANVLILRERRMKKANGQLSSG